jgi:hypothetical protein
MGLEHLEDAIADAVERAVDDDFEAQRIFDAEILRIFAPLTPSVRSRLASKIAYDYDDRLRKFIDPKAGPIPSDGPKRKSKTVAVDVSPFRFWKASDGRQFAYTTSRERDEKDRERFVSFAIKKDGGRRDVVRHAKKKDAMLRAARLMIEHEVQVAPAHAKDAFAAAVAVAKKAERTDDLWESLAAARKAAKEGS